MLGSGHTKTAPAEAGAVAPTFTVSAREGEGAGSRVSVAGWRKPFTIGPHDTANLGRRDQRAAARARLARHVESRALAVLGRGQTDRVPLGMIGRTVRVVAIRRALFGGQTAPRARPSRETTGHPRRGAVVPEANPCGEAGQHLNHDRPNLRAGAVSACAHGLGDP